MPAALPPDPDDDAGGAVRRAAARARRAAPAAELRRPLGIAIVGGLCVSQLLTLFTTPVIYLALHRFTRRDSKIGQLTQPGLARVIGDVPQGAASFRIEDGKFGPDERDRPPND